MNSGRHNPRRGTRTPRRGFTLVEMLVVAAIIAILATFAIVSIRALTGGLQESSARMTLKTLLASARAEAASRGHLVGVRFQQDATGRTYGVIIHEKGVETVWGVDGPVVVFQAAEGREPFRFPQGVELARGDALPRDTDDATDDATNDAILQDGNLPNITRFSIVFRSNGQLAVVPMRVVQRNNMDSIFYSPDPNEHPQPGTSAVVCLLPDDTAQSGNTYRPVARISQSSAWILERNARRQAGVYPWTNYLKVRTGTAWIDINPYTGQLR